MLPLRRQAVHTSLKEQGASRLAERRKDARYTLILRVGLLEQGGKSSLCLVKNISSTGVKVKIYTQPVRNSDVCLRVADEAPVHGHLVWVEGDVAGINFHEELDAATLLRVQQKLRPNRRRAMPRVAVEAVATLRTGGQTFRATICDISSLGARVRTRSGLVAGDRVMAALQDLPPIKAYVRWSDGEDSGLVFETAIPMQIIAGWIDGRVRLGV